MIVKTIMECLAGKETLKLLMDVLEEQSADLVEVRQRCTRAIQILRDAALQPSVDGVMTAIYGQTASTFLFSLCLGMKDNLDHFIDPLARTFLEVDGEAYLREGMLRQLPQYIEARAVWQQFAGEVPTELQSMYEDIAAYAAHLDVLVPKLAHYYGYLLGNELYSYTVPGYYPDSRLTIQYRRMLEHNLEMEMR